MTLEKALRLFNLAKFTKDQKVLKKRYRKLAFKFHPDKGGTEAKFLEIHTAYEFLCNYTPKKNNSNNSSKNTTNKTNFHHFGKERKKRRKRALDAQDIVLDMEVSVKELYDGFKQELKYARRFACESCNGRGCIICEGSIKHQTIGLEVGIHSTLMNSNLEIIYEGYGDKLKETADLVLKMKIDDKSFFQIGEVSDRTKVLDITSKMSVIPKEGEFSIDVLTLDGKKPITISKGDKSFKTLRLKNRGLVFTNKQGVQIRGDHLVTILFT